MADPIAVRFALDVDKDGIIELKQAGPRDDAGCFPNPTTLIDDVKDNVQLGFRTVWDEDEPLEGLSIEMRAYHVRGENDVVYHLGLEMWVGWRDAEAMHAQLGAMIAAKKAGALV